MLRVAIAGCHRQLLRQPGSHNFASAFCANPETVVAGVFDYGEKERSEFVECWRDVWGEVPAFDDYGRLLDEVRPDIVCIATRQTLHAGQIEQAVAADARGILCDKPLVTSLAELDRVAAACESTPLAFALDRRWNPAYHALRSALDARRSARSPAFLPTASPIRSTTAVTGTTPCSCSSATRNPPWVSGFLDPGDPHDERRRRDPPCRRRSAWQNGVHAYVTCDGRGASPSRSPPRAGGSPCTASPHPRRRLGRADPPAAEGRGLARRHGHGRRVRAVKEGGRTVCDVPQARRATEIGFAIWSSSQRDGARVRLPADDRGLRVESYPWGNEAPT